MCGGCASRACRVSLQPWQSLIKIALSLYDTKCKIKLYTVSSIRILKLARVFPIIAIIFQLFLLAQTRWCHQLNNLTFLSDLSWIDLHLSVLFIRVYQLIFQLIFQVNERLPCRTKIFLLTMTSQINLNLWIIISGLIRSAKNVLNAISVKIPNVRHLKSAPMQSL